MVGFKPAHRCPQLTVETLLALSGYSPLSRLMRAIRADRVEGRVGQDSSLISKGNLRHGGICGLITTLAMIEGEIYVVNAVLGDK